MRDQSPIVRLDLHERLPLDALKGRVEEILDLELIPEVEMNVGETQVVLSGHMTIKGTYLAETLPFSEYEWEQEPSEEVRVQRTSEQFPFVYQIPLEIVLPRHRVPEPDQLRVSVSQMDFDLSSPHELEVLAELVVEGVQGAGRRDEAAAEPWMAPGADAMEGIGEVAPDAAPAWTLQLAAGQRPAEPEPDDTEIRDAIAQAADASETFADFSKAPADATASPDDAFEAVAWAESPKFSSQKDGHPGNASSGEAASIEDETWKDAPRKGTESVLSADAAIENAELQDEYDEASPSATPESDEADNASDESVRVSVHSHAKEPSRLSSNTWSEWLTAAKKPPVQPISGEPDGTALSHSEQTSISGLPSSDASPAISGASWKAPGEEQHSLQASAPVDASDRGSEAAETATTLSDYLAPILKGKAERFVSLRLYRVPETEHLEDVAQQFNVSVTELMRLNRMAEPTFVSAGNVLFIPVKKE